MRLWLSDAALLKIPPESSGSQNIEDKPTGLARSRLTHILSLPFIEATISHFYPKLIIWPGFIKQTPAQKWK
jgi:hypothetical protein